MECQSGVTPSIIDQICSFYIQQDKIADESVVTRSIID